jgi:hypothetical protein
MSMAIGDMFSEPATCSSLVSLYDHHHRRMDRASAVLCEGLDPTKHRTYAALPESGSVPYSTLWHRAHGRRSRREKAESQQYLTP